MSIADEIYAARQIDRQEQAVRREKMRLDLRRAHDAQSPRYLRSAQGANALLAMLSSYIPDACRDGAYDDLMLNLFGANVALIEVPQEHDALRDAEFKKAALRSKRTK